ncbi:MAG: hypothetical protein AAGA88_10515 [Pseudomonadota bacterium]
MSAVDMEAVFQGRCGFGADDFGRARYVLPMIRRVGLKRHFLLVALLLVAPAAAEDRNRATFSDERGGFSISSVVGTGKSTDPIIVSQSYFNAGPALLIVRSGYSGENIYLNAIRPDVFSQAVTFIVRNDTDRPWVGFDFELQQVEEEPSVFSDGLSFDQPGMFASRPFLSDRFEFLQRDAEPYDRLQFREGSVAPGATVRFDVNLVDITPVPEFYLLLQPIIPYS